MHMITLIVVHDRLCHEIGLVLYKMYILYQNISYIYIYINFKPGIAGLNLVDLGVCVCNWYPGWLVLPNY